MYLLLWAGMSHLGQHKIFLKTILLLLLFHVHQVTPLLSIPETQAYWFL